MTWPGEAANQTAPLRYRYGAAKRTTRSGTCFRLKVETCCISKKKKHECFLFALCSRVWAGSRRAKLLLGCSEQRVSEGEDPGQSFTTWMHGEETLARVSLGFRLSWTQTRTHDRFSTTLFLCTFCCSTLEKGDGSATFSYYKNKKQHLICKKKKCFFAHLRCE